MTDFNRKWRVGARWRCRVERSHRGPGFGFHLFGRWFDFGPTDFGAVVQLWRRDVRVGYFK